MVKYLVYLIIGIPVILVIDIFARFLYSKSWFSNVVLSTEINPMDILGILISALIAIWLGWYITRKLSALRFQKEYLISDIKRIEEEIIIFEDKMQVSNLDLQVGLDLLNKFWLYIDRFSKTIDIFQITYIDMKKLVSYYSSLYSTTTNVEGDLITIDEGMRIKINSICSSMITETRYMIFVINKE